MAIVFNCMDAWCDLHGQRDGGGGTGVAVDEGDGCCWDELWQRKGDLRRNNVAQTLIWKCGSAGRPL
eukprot:2858315-Lingulodinium_polyedra.AAC.1